MVQLPQEVNNILRIIIEQFGNNKLKPLHSANFDISNAENAFEYLQRAKNIGKVVLTFPKKQFQIDATASYLITGGLGGLGRKVAQWMALQGAKHLVLIGRKASEKIEIPNATVETVAIDISQKAEVDKLLQKFGKEWPELKGIIHAAGVLDDATLLSQDWTKFEKVFAPKVQGTLNLHSASLDKPLNFFILFSSITSTLGGSGQSNYAAANAFLDCFASYRDQQNLPALSINWGPWAEVGLAAELVHVHEMKGWNAMNPEQAIRALELAMQHNHPNLFIADMNWKIYQQKIQYFPRLLEELASTQPKQESAETLGSRLRQTPAAKKKEVIKKYLQDLLIHLLNLPPGRPILEKQGFFHLGMDSLMAVEFRNKLQADVGDAIPLSASLLFDQPNLEALANHLLLLLFPEEAVQKSEVKPKLSIKEIRELLE